MRRAYLLALILLVAGAVVPLALAGSSLLQQAIYAGGIPQTSCASVPLEPFGISAGPFDGSVVLHLTNEGTTAATARVCLFQGGTKRMDTAVALGAAETQDLVVEAPPGVYTYRMEASDQLPDGRIVSTHGSGTFSTMWCLSHSGDTRQSFFVGPEGSGGTASGGDCIPAPMVVGIVGLLAAGGAFLLGKFPGLGALLLYSRLVKPRILDSVVRAQVFEIVGREPGIHSRALIRSLGAAEGQTAYHLGVLAREKLLVSVGVPGMRHWFVTGRYSPEQMRALATLRDPTRRRVYDAVVASPGASLSAVIDGIGVSMPQGSRAARALERAGLIERRSDGRALSLVPTAPEVPEIIG